MISNLVRVPIFLNIHDEVEQGRRNMEALRKMRRDALRQGKHKCESCDQVVSASKRWCLSCYQKNVEKFNADREAALLKQKEAVA